MHRQSARETVQQQTSLLFFNALNLEVRIRVENRALKAHAHTFFFCKGSGSAHAT